MQIVEVTSGKGALCAAILKTLPDWFGIPDANAAYERAVETMPMFAAFEDERALGFLALKRHTPHAAEIHVMGVRPEHHRAGLGRALVARAERYVLAIGARFLTVKTLSPKHPDPGYAKTRAFYAAAGFLALEEFPDLWDPENPSLMLIKVLN
jgi:GNAT superfamily N-acetyltransferase